MNTPIQITSESLQDTDIAIIASNTGKFVSVFGSNKLPQRLPDFGTMFIGFSSKEEIEQEEIIELLVQDGDLIWMAPTEWKMGHLAKRFGMFPSVSQAIKNNFGSEIPFGFSQVQIRANKMRGVLTIFKK